jgi:hypothetical protein
MVVVTLGANHVVVVAVAVENHTPAPRHLAHQPREIELVADFLLAKVVGKGPMDRAKCVEYWGSDVDACREFK